MKEYEVDNYFMRKRKFFEFVLMKNKLTLEINNHVFHSILDVYPVDLFQNLSSLYYPVQYVPIFSEQVSDVKGCYCYFFIIRYIIFSVFPVSLFSLTILTI